MFSRVRLWCRGVLLDHHADERCLPGLVRLLDDPVAAVPGAYALHSLGCQPCKPAPLPWRSTWRRCCSAWPRATVACGCAGRRRTSWVASPPTRRAARRAAPRGRRRPGRQSPAQRPVGPGAARPGAAGRADRAPLWGCRSVVVRGARLAIISARRRRRVRTARRLAGAGGASGGGGGDGSGRGQGGAREVGRRAGGLGAGGARRRPVVCHAGGGRPSLHRHRGGRPGGRPAAPGGGDRPQRGGGDGARLRRGGAPARRSPGRCSAGPCTSWWPSWARRTSRRGAAGCRLLAPRAGGVAGGRRAAALNAAPDAALQVPSGAPQRPGRPGRPGGTVWATRTASPCSWSAPPGRRFAAVGHIPYGDRVRAGRLNCGRLSWSRRRPVPEQRVPLFRGPERPRPEGPSCLSRRAARGAAPGGRGGDRGHRRWWMASWRRPFAPAARTPTSCWWGPARPSGALALRARGGRAERERGGRSGGRPGAAPGGP